MPHLFVNRPRMLGLTRSPAELWAHHRWEAINAAVYDLGGVVFIVGSVLFFPRFEGRADIGAWLFFAGSLLYIVVAGHDVAEAARNHRRQDDGSSQSLLELATATGYLVGSILFAVGSISFLSWVNLADAAAWMFVAGSLLFVGGACINVLQIVRERSLMTLQLMNLTAVSFIVGSVLFAVASVPYLWQVPSAAERATLHTYLAWLYVVGSALFLLGGVFNYWRASILIRQDPGDSPSTPPRS